MKSLVTSAVTVSIVMFALCAAPVEGTVLRLRAYPNNLVVMRPSEKSEDKAAGLSETILLLVGRT